MLFCSYVEENDVLTYFRYEDITCLQKCMKLRELSLEENPVSKQSNYFHIAVARFYKLKR